MYKFKLKFWLEKNGKFLIGEGIAELLNLIAKYNSLAQAAKLMGMSYRHAWGDLKKLENLAGIKIVSSTRGGALKGVTKLTEQAEELLKMYNERKKVLSRTMRYPSPALTTDGIIIRKNKILLIKRKKEPFRGYYALPGGFVNYNEKVEDSIVREVREETGLVTKVEYIFGVYSSPERDPRCHTVSIVYKLKVLGGKLIASQKEVEKLGFFSLQKLNLKLAFDHNRIIQDYLARKERKCYQKKNV
jgi:8-oxo-dGTP diphosphatase